MRFGNRYLNKERRIFLLLNPIQCITHNLIRLLLFYRKRSRLQVMSRYFLIQEPSKCLFVICFGFILAAMSISDKIIKFSISLSICMVFSNQSRTIPTLFEHIQHIFLIIYIRNIMICSHMSCTGKSSR